MSKSPSTKTKDTMQTTSSALSANLFDDITMQALKISLDEDIGSGDITSELTIAADAKATMHFMARQKMVVCGIPVVQKLIEIIDNNLQLCLHTEDGQYIESGTCIMSISGNARSELLLERTALNFLQKLSGIATLSRQYKDAAKDTNAQVLDTRKTTPCLRSLEKYAVKIGGCHNHRKALYDAILIKDNHIAIAGGLQKTVIAAQQGNVNKLKIEVECDNLEQVAQAIEVRPDIIMLDNMNLEMLRTAVQMNNGAVKLEASGGVNLSTIKDIAKTGIDYISVGALTHSAPNIDIGLDFDVN